MKTRKNHTETITPRSCFISYHCSRKEMTLDSHFKDLLSTIKKQTNNLGTLADFVVCAIHEPFWLWLMIAQSFYGIFHDDQGFFERNKISEIFDTFSRLWNHPTKISWIVLRMDLLALFFCESCEPDPFAQRIQWESFNAANVQSGCSITFPSQLAIARALSLSLSVLNWLCKKPCIDKALHLFAFISQMSL